MKILLWLDDYRDCFSDPEWLVFSPIDQDEVVWVKNYTEFVRYINDIGIPDAISFDHDLGEFINGEEKTGYNCVQYLVDYCIDNNIEFPEYNIHSANPVGKDNMKFLIENYKKYYNKKGA